MRFRILGSSSAGNSALLCTPRCKVLIDAGFTGKRMEALLELAGTALEQIDAIFITHEHSDHISGLRGLTRKHPELKLFANADTARVIQDKMPRKLNWHIFENGSSFTYLDLQISPFPIPHDAYDPVGYLFSYGSDSSPASVRRSVCWLTDLGYVTNLAREHASQCDLLVIEANHDPELLERCETRSWSTKQRIRGRHGHLSNQAAFELLAAVEDPQWKHVCLAHISAECNHLDIVRKQFEPLRSDGRKLDIHIFDPSSPVPGPEFNLSADLANESIGIAATTAARAEEAVSCDSITILEETETVTVLTGSSTTGSKSRFGSAPVQIEMSL